MISGRSSSSVPARATSRGRAARSPPTPAAPHPRRRTRRAVRPAARRRGGVRGAVPALSALRRRARRRLRSRGAHRRDHAQLPASSTPPSRFEPGRPAAQRRRGHLRRHRGRGRDVHPDSTACSDFDPIELTVNGTLVATLTPYLGVCFGCGNTEPMTYTVPLEDIRPLLHAGTNRLGIRKGGDPFTPRTLLFWAYATVTANGVAERVTLFDSYNDGEPFGTSHLDMLDTCQVHPEYQAVDAGADVHLCTPVATTTWSGTLPLRPRPRAARDPPRLHAHGPRHRRRGRAVHRRDPRLHAQRGRELVAERRPMPVRCCPHFGSMR